MTHSDLWRAIDKLAQQEQKLRVARAKEHALATTAQNTKK